MPKFCKDCKHCELSTFYNRLSFWPFIKGKPTDKSYANAKCGHPKGVEDNDKERFLTGSTKAEHIYCFIARKELVYRECCGPEGKWFEEKASA